MKDPETIRIFIADDHAVTREGIKTIISTVENFVFAGEASNGLEAVKLCREKKPDIVLMDLDMPVMDGNSAIKIIKKENPEIKIIALTSFPDQKMVKDAFKHGAEGYLLKTTSADEILSAIKDTVSGRVSLSKEVADAIFKDMELPAEKYHLSGQELKILNLLAKGYSNKKISEILYISHHTVKFHISNLLSKMGASTRAEASAIAIKENLIT